jgi:hypothetical protein
MKTKFSATAAACVFVLFVATALWEQDKAVGPPAFKVDYR